MATVTNAILNGDAYQGNIPSLDLARGGQFGYSPNLQEWISNQAYVKQNLVILLLEAPLFFSKMNNPQKWVEALKAMVEVHPKSIEGFNAGLEVSVEEHAVGGAGEMQQEVSDVKRARTQPIFNYTDKYGAPIQSLVEQWITVGLKDPETKAPLLNTFGNDAPGDLLANWYSMSVLAFEPDPTGKKVTRAWVTTNMYPMNTGDITGKRDLNSPNELSDLAIPFTGISQYSIGTTLFAQQLLDQINTTNANPSLQPSFIQDLEADVKASSDTGYKAGVEEMANNSVA